MLGIFDAIKGFFEFVISIFQFILNLIKDLVFVVKLVGEAVLKLPSMLGFLPTSIISLVMVCISVVVIYKVVGRD